MRSDLIIFSSPLTYQYLCFFQSRKYLPVQQFISHLSVKGLYITVLPGTTRFNKQRPYTQPIQPFPHSSGSKFGSIVRADMFRYTSEDKQVVELINNTIRL